MFWPVVLIQNLLLLISGFTLLILAGDKLVETSVRIAKRWKIPASVIAVTLIAAGTSAPELVTSFLAAYRQSSDISVGNVVGSNIFNILAVGGLSILFQPSGKVSSSFFSWLLLILGSFLFFFLLNDLHLSQMDGIILSLAIVAFIFISFYKTRNNDEPEEEKPEGEKSFIRTIVFFCISFVGLVFGAELALTGGVELGRLAGLSERVIAITIISVGTGLPELATSIAAALRGHNDVAIANIIGSNVFNTLAIPGLTASFFPLVINEKLLSFDTSIMIAATFALGLIFLIKKAPLRRLLGMSFFAAYVTYTLKLILF